MVAHVPFLASSFRIVLATPLNSNTIRVFFSLEPRHQSPLSSNDALNRRNWSLEVLAGAGPVPTIESVENALPQPTIFSSLPDAWSVDLRLDQRLLLATSYRTTANAAIRSALASSALDPLASSGTHPGISVARPRRPPRSSRAVDGVDLFYDTFQGLWRLDGRRDLDVHAGDDARRKRIIRRLITARGGFKHLPGYGVGLRTKEPVTTTRLAELRSEIRLQLLEEEDLEDVRVDANQIPDGVVVRIVAKPRASAGIEMTFEVPSEGPIVVA